MRTAVLAAVLALAAVPARAELRVSMHDGRVSIVASDVTVRQILAEWARVGQTKIVNGDGLAGGPITLQMTDVPEEQALDILLRSASGYLAAPRAVPVSNASHFDRVIIVPTSSPSRAPISAPPPVPQPRFPQNAQNPDEDDAPQNRPQPPQRLGGEPGFNPQGAPQGGAAPPPYMPTATPTAPPGLSVPGMVLPTPTVPGQPAQPPPPPGPR